MDDLIKKLQQLDAERDKLINMAKNNAMKTVEKGLEELHALGFEYELVEVGQKPKPRAAGTRTRRSGQREAILEALKAAPLARADLLEKMGAKGDQKQEQSISNALSNMKKAGQIDQTDGKYHITGAQ